MTKGQRTVSGLLAAVVVLLGLNLIVKTSPVAVGQQQVSLQQPVPVGIAAGQNITGNGSGTAVFHVFRLWSDGGVDTSRFTFTFAETCELVGQCGPLPLIPGSCPADVIRDGDVGTTDFLEVLGQWGPCE